MCLWVFCRNYGLTMSKNRSYWIFTSYESGSHSTARALWGSWWQPVWPWPPCPHIGCRWSAVTNMPVPAPGCPVRPANNMGHCLSPFVRSVSPCSVECRCLCRRLATRHPQPDGPCQGTSGGKIYLINILALISDTSWDKDSFWGLAKIDFFYY